MNHKRVFFFRFFFCSSPVTGRALNSSVDSLHLGVSLCFPKLADGQKGKKICPALLWKRWLPSSRFFNRLIGSQVSSGMWKTAWPTAAANLCKHDSAFFVSFLTYPTSIRNPAASWRVRTAHNGVYIRFPICLHFGVEGFHIYSVFHLVWPQRVEGGDASAFAVDFADFQTGGRCESWWLTTWGKNTQFRDLGYHEIEPLPVTSICLTRIPTRRGAARRTNSGIPRELTD